MKMQIISGLALAIALGSSSAYAVNQKTNSSYDPRIKSVVYNPLDVVELDAVVGLSTHIVVAPDETYVTHVFGNEGAWTFTHKDNNFFLRPMAELSDTNLTIVTNKRTYYVLLRYVGSNTVRDKNGQVKELFIKTPWTMRQATVGLLYKYPFEDMQAANKKLEERRIQEALNGKNNNPHNLNYQMSDEPEFRSLQPINVYDNYRFTYFVFPENAELPALFVIGSDGKESVVNADVEGKNNNILVAPMTAKGWRIRYGEKVVGVVNNGFNPSIGANPSGTASPAVRRVQLPQGGE